MQFTVLVEEKRKGKVIINANTFADAKFEARKKYYTDSGNIVWTEKDISCLSEEIIYTKNGVKVSTALNDDFWNNNAKDLVVLLSENGKKDSQEVLNILNDWELTLSIINNSKNEKFLSFSSDILKSIIMTALINLQRAYDMFNVKKEEVNYIWKHI